MGMPARPFKSRLGKMAGAVYAVPAVAVLLESEYSSVCLESQAFPIAGFHQLLGAKQQPLPNRH